MTTATIEKNTSAWRMQVWMSFAFSLGLTLMGIYFLPVDIWTRGFMLMGVMFTVGSTFSLAKTVRDDHEAGKLIHKVENARTEELLSKYSES